MSKMATFRKRRLRRTNKQVMRHGSTAKRKHKRISGRTGSIHSKQLAGAKND